MKRICIVRHREYPDAVPMRRNAETLVQHGYEVDVLCIKKNKEKSREVINGVNVYRLPLVHRREDFFRYLFEYCAFFLLASLKLTQLSLTRRYKVIQIDNMPDFIVFTALIPRLLGAKVVFQLLDHTPQVFADTLGVDDNHIIVRCLRFLEKISVRWADYCIGTQIMNKQIMERHGVPGSKIAIVLNVPDDNFGNQPIAGNENKDFCLITHGNLLEKYGVQTLVKAVPLLVRDIPNLKVKIVGKGEYLPTLKELAKSLNIEDYVQFTGWVPPETVPHYISEADIGIVSIRAVKNPMLPNKLFEYLALGKPSVVTALPIIRYYFRDDSVMYYKPDDAVDLAKCILELYKNPEKRKTLAASGASAYEQYRWKRMKFEYLDVIEKMCGNSHQEKFAYLPTGVSK